MTLIIAFIWADYQNDKICESHGYEKTIGWNSAPVKLFVLFGQPNESYVDCVKGDEYKRFYDEVEE